MTTPDLTGRIALVTGASRGIGYFVAKHMAAAGAHVIAVARTVGGLEELDDDIKATRAETFYSGPPAPPGLGGGDAGAARSRRHGRHRPARRCHP